MATFTWQTPSCRRMASNPHLHTLKTCNWQSVLVTFCPTGNIIVVVVVVSDIALSLYAFTLPHLLFSHSFSVCVSIRAFMRRPLVCVISAADVDVDAHITHSYILFICLLASPDDLASSFPPSHLPQNDVFIHRSLSFVSVRPYYHERQPCDQRHEAFKCKLHLKKVF